MRDELIFLGTGTSFGVPMLGCECQVCRSSDPRDRRGRCSGLFVVNGKRILVDPTPDFRQQALREGIDRLDAVLVTHVHADHVMGLDDLRPLSLAREAALPIYGTAETTAELRQLFGYAFASIKKRPGLPWLSLVDIEPGRPFEALPGIEVLPLPMRHGRGTSMTYRIGNTAWATDLKEAPDSSVDRLQGLELLALDMLREEPPHATHLALSESLALRERIGSPPTWFIHMGHEVEHASLEARLPAGTGLAYDGFRAPLR